MPRLIDSYRARPRIVREAVLAVAALLVGVIALPIAVYLVGERTLGPYAHGGFFSFWADFFRGLASGGLPWWLIALGPYALYVFARGARAAFRLTAR